MVKVCVCVNASFICILKYYYMLKIFIIKFIIIYHLNYLPTLGSGRVKFRVVFFCLKGRQLKINSLRSQINVFETRKSY